MKAHPTIFEIRQEGSDTAEIRIAQEADTTLYIAVLDGEAHEGFSSKGEAEDYIESYRTRQDGGQV